MFSFMYYLFAYMLSYYFSYSPLVMLSIQGSFSKYHFTVFSIPSSNWSDGSQPSSFWSLVESIA